MVSIYSISNSLAEGLASRVPNIKYDSVEDQIDVYTYVFMFYVGIFIKIFLLVSLALLLGVVASSLTLMFTFASLRSIGGGYHFTTFGKCMIISLLIFLGSALTAQYTYQYWSSTNIWYLITFCIISMIYIIYRYVPKDSPNNIIDDRETISKFKKLTVYYLIIWSMLMSIFVLLNIKIIVIASCFGLLLEVFTISTLGYNFYARLDK